MYLVAAIALAWTIIPTDTIAGRIVGFLAIWVVPLPMFDLLSVTVAIMLAASLQRRKRVAWRMLLGVLIFQLVLLVIQLAMIFAGAAEVPAAECRWC